MDRILHAMGLMSGTSLDGIDAALIKTDGTHIREQGEWLTVPYAPQLRKELRGLLEGEGDSLLIEQAMTKAHAEVVALLLKQAGLVAQDIDVIGFHGQTIIHRPQEGISWQLGNGGLLAELTGIDVVCDFRRRDMAAGGQGAPLVPLYHAAIAATLPRPLAVVNIGGVANVTWIGEDSAKDIIAFDTGPGNALLDDWVRIHTGKDYDASGKLAASGKVDEKCLAALLAHPFFAALPPKSLDRNSFASIIIGHLSAADGAATLAAFTVQSLLLARNFFPAQPKAWVIAGGGRHNDCMMKQLQQGLQHPVNSIDALGFSGDALEAQAFAFLAVRSLYGLPLSLPGTTGATRPVTGGAFYRA
jgi:anhydro-N-acetylmuramic acid kinase